MKGYNFTYLKSLFFLMRGQKRKNFISLWERGYNFTVDNPEISHLAVENASYPQPQEAARKRPKEIPSAIPLP